MAKVARFTQDNQNPVGMIVQSMLTEAQFQAANGTNWVLADGRDVTGSVYASTTGGTNIPDLRGVVLRGKNNGRSDGFQNPVGDSTLGTYQGDQFLSHDHGGGAHTHSTQYAITRNDSGSYHAAGGVIGHIMRYDGIGGGEFGGNRVWPGEGQISTNGASTTVISPNGGASETRMRNVTVNHFIKIN